MRDSRFAEAQKNCKAFACMHYMQHHNEEYIRGFKNIVRMSPGNGWKATTFTNEKQLVS